MALASLPAKITPREMSISGYYIVKQTHEPVFRKEDGYNYTSKILKSWSRSIDYRSYTLCPDTSQSFDALHPFSLDSFRRHIIEITPKFDDTGVIKEDRGCLQISFTHPAQRYLDFLATYANAPSVKISSSVEIGLGPFMLESMNKKEIVLLRKGKVARGFNKIRVYDFSGAKSQSSQKDFISDYNFALGRKDLAALGPEYVHFENMSLKSAVLLINLPDSERRRILYNCMDIDGLRTVFTNGPGNFRDIQTILPLGVPGGRPGKPRQACTITKAGAKKLKQMTFANWQADRSLQFESFFNEFYRKTGIRIKVENFKPAELSAGLHARKKPYELVIMITAPDSDDKFRFLASYFGKKNVRDQEIAGIAEMYNELIRASSSEKEKVIAQGIADRIRENYALLPLYQTVSTVYYPREIKNIVAGKELLEYPDVADFIW